MIARNLIVYNMYDRDPWFWIDQPPPERVWSSVLGRTLHGRHHYVEKLLRG